MIKLLKRIGRFNSVIVVTVIAAAASLNVTMIAVAALNGQGFNLNSEIAAILSLCLAIRYTPGLGLTAFDTESEADIDDLLARSDLARYQASQAGRYQTATFNPQLTQLAAG